MTLDFSKFRTRPCTLCGTDDYKVAPHSEVEFDDGMAAIFIC